MQFTEIKLTEYFKEDNASNNDITISVERAGMTIPDMVDNIIRPLLLAYSYHPDLVDQYVPKTEVWDYGL